MRLLYALALIGIQTMAAVAQVPDQFVGEWRLVSFLSTDSSGQLRPVWGTHPSGLIVYTRNGYVSAQLYDPGRRPLGQIAFAVLFAVAQPSFSGLYSYFGSVTVDTNAHLISHHVQGAMAPDWVGGTLVRAYRFLGPDHLELRVVTDAAGRALPNGSVLMWERATRPAR